MQWENFNGKVTLDFALYKGLHYQHFASRLRQFISSFWHYIGPGTPYNVDITGQTTYLAALFGIKPYRKTE